MAARQKPKQQGHAYTGDLFDRRAIIRVPRRFEVASKVNGNPVFRLAFLEHDRAVTISSFQAGRRAGFLATSADGIRTYFTNRKHEEWPDCDEVLRVERADSIDEIVEDLAAGRGQWVLPAPLEPTEKTLRPLSEQFLSSLEDKFIFREEEESADGTRDPGLRRPQIGALHAALAHWSVTSSAATIVMPTGTGKTETMMALLANQQLHRLLIIVPTASLRDQIADKFTTLGILPKCGCLLAGAEFPVVMSLQHRPKTVNDVDEIFNCANVIVSNIQVVGQCEADIQERMAELCSHLFIDEAHHIAAKTWNDFKSKFSSKPVLQFTATPFRTDGKRVDGKFIYSYPLAKAQAEGYFRPINFIPITEYDDDQADERIAEEAKRKLLEDLEAGHDHILMARVDSIERARVVHELYCQILSEYSPVVVHNKVPLRDRREAFRKLHARESRAIVCVDMLGEGFDFPELKIAALHDRHKSLAITLQFVGRFTRAKEHIGDASVIANVADEGISNALRLLYAEDADWNYLLRVLGQGATDRARKRAEILEGFTSALPEIPLQTLFPRMSAVVYRTTCESWDPTKVEDVIPGPQLFAGPVINPEHNLAIFVTRDEELVRWGAVKQVQNVEWNLYVIHWDEEQQLLFINSSKPKEFHERIAEALTGSTERMRGELVFRILGGIRRLTLTNLGLSHAFGKNIRYTMFMGADIAEGLTQSIGTNKKKSNLFGLGYENEEKVSVGCSFKGRIWSYKVAFDLSEWVEWCHHIGRKLLDASISTEDVFKNLIVATRITARPALVPVMASWPEGFQEQPEEIVELQIGNTPVPFFECDIGIHTHSATGPLRFIVSVAEKEVEFELRILEDHAEFSQVSGDPAYVIVKGKRTLLADAFNIDPPIIYFANGDFLVFNELFKLPRGDERITFDLGKILESNWSNVDIRKESQGEEKAEDSIQRHMINRILDGEFGHFDIVFDDDGKGEAGDIVAIRRDDRKLVVRLFHCKYSSGAEPGRRLNDLYTVCGQAQKSIRWREDPRKLLKHLLHREDLRVQNSRASRFERGTRQELRALQNLARELSFEYQVTIVQPGLSKAQLTPEHIDLLGATENFLMETYSMSLDVFASA